MRFWFAFALACLVPVPAIAVGQGEASLSVGGGLAIEGQGQARAGAAAEFRLLRGLSDTWSARLGLQASVLPSSQGEKARTLLSQAAGVTWAIDVVSWVPFLDLGVVVGDVRGGGARASQRLGGQAGLGVDYLVSRHAVISFLGRVDYLPFRLAGAEQPGPTQLSFILHLGRTF
jgi:hypothetical protein